MMDLDHTVCNELSKYVELLTTNGKKEIDQEVMKKIKKICKASDEYVKHIYYLLMTQLNKEHSEIRYSTLLVIHELFIRSHVFKELLLSDFQNFLELTAETDPDEPLPPPKKAAKELKLKTLQIVQEWYEKFKEGYKRLTLAYNFLKDCKKVDFNDAQARTIAQRNREQQQQQRHENALQEKLKRIEKEIKEMIPEINATLAQMDNLFQLLVLPVEDIFTESDFKESKTLVIGNKSKKMSEDMNESLHSHCELHPSNEIKETDSNEQEGAFCSVTNGVKLTEKKPAEHSNCHWNLRQHGVTDMKYNLAIEIAPKPAVTIEENEENSAIIENIQDQHKLIVSHFLPKIGKWLKVLAKGSDCSNQVKRAIDLKQELEARVSKFREMKFKPKTCHSEEKPNSDDDDDDDFEEVQEKEGFEPVIPLHCKKEYGLAVQPSTSGASEPKTSIERHWNLNLEEQDIRDPTSRYSTLHALCQKLATKSVKRESSESPSCSQNNSNLTNDKKEKLLSQAPHRPYDIDLYHCEDEKLEVPSVVKESTESPSCSQNDSNITNDRKEKLLAQAPRRPYDIDLYHWEDEKLEAPSVVKFDSLHNFWQLHEKETEFQDQEGIASLRRRVIAFTGEFEPVKWSCRAPLPSGKLCSRQDRYKCPFHGCIIPRDAQGNPTNPEDQNKLQEQQPSTSEEVIPDWQDPELLRDLEAATGVNLKMPSKRKKHEVKTGKNMVKGKKRKRYPGLTDIKTSENTARKRLENKVLNKRSVQRVANALDAVEKKLFLDKFGNQWNYSFKL